jgi:HD-like signal output (HDOD) protein
LRSRAIQKGLLKQPNLPHVLNGLIASFLSPSSKRTQVKYEDLATKASEKAYSYPPKVSRMPSPESLLAWMLVSQCSIISNPF